LSEAVAAACYCRNCELFLGDKPGNFCPHCGQETKLESPGFWGFAHEFVGHYLAVEGTLWKTLAKLFFRPGALSLEYRAGRRRQYILPLRLYLTASLLFFLIVKIFGAGTGLNLGLSGERPRSVVETRDSAKTRQSKPIVDTIECDQNTGACAKIKQYVAAKYGDKTSGDVGNIVFARLKENAPYAMFLLLPVFAFLTMVAYWRRRLPYGEHMVYALHVHAFAFFSLLAMALTNKISPLVPVAIALAGLIYCFIAMHRFFGGRRWLNLLRYAGIALAYWTILGIAVLAALLAAFFW
jgi:Protein of unknown function (DUF3667)